MPCNRAILHLSNVMITADDDIPVHFESQEDEEFYYSSMTSMMDLASILKPSHPLSSMLSRSMQKKLQGLLNCQVLEPEGRSKLLRHARSVGERCLSEILVKQQDTRALSSNLWTAVRQKGCQFLGPVVQEEALNMVLTALKDGTELSRRVLVDYVVHKLSEDFPNQSTKTAIGHVIQLLYRASCFNVSTHNKLQHDLDLRILVWQVTKREESSSLMQLKEEYRSYESLRREHDAQIVSIAQDSGLRICPEQWSFLLYGDALHKSHMQSIIDRVSLSRPRDFLYTWVFLGMPCPSCLPFLCVTRVCCRVSCDLLLFLVYFECTSSPKLPASQVSLLWRSLSWHCSLPSSFDVLSTTTASIARIISTVSSGVDSLLK